MMREAEVVAHVVPLLERERSDLDPSEGVLLARALLGVLGSRGQHRLSLPRRTDEHVDRHFASKSDILVAAANRGGERIRIAVDDVVSDTCDPSGMLAALLRAHVKVVIQERHLVGTLSNEADQLPEEDRRALRPGTRESRGGLLEQAGEASRTSEAAVMSDKETYQRQRCDLDRSAVSSDHPRRQERDQHESSDRQCVGTADQPARSRSAGPRSAARRLDVAEAPQSYR